jgi:hypothetical protein
MHRNNVRLSARGRSSLFASAFGGDRLGRLSDRVLSDRVLSDRSLANWNFADRSFAGGGRSRSAATAAFSVTSDAVTMRNFIRRSCNEMVASDLYRPENTNRTRYSMSPFNRKYRKT